VTLVTSLGSREHEFATRLSLRPTARRQGAGRDPIVEHVKRGDATVAILLTITIKWCRRCPTTRLGRHGLSNEEPGSAERLGGSLRRSRLEGLPRQLFGYVAANNAAKLYEEYMERANPFTKLQDKVLRRRQAGMSFNRIWTIFWRQFRSAAERTLALLSACGIRDFIVRRADPVPGDDFAARQGAARRPGHGVLPQHADPGAALSGCISHGLKFGITFTPWQSAVTALAMQSSGYLAEEFRAGIGSIDRGR
jgi:hypothetical protein